MEKAGVLVGGGGPLIRLPPGFRFHPTDEELVVQYLRRKVLSCPLPASIIPDIELSRFDPWDLPVGGAAVGSSEKEKYFFNRKEAKYRIGSRANRAAGSGYWKATGRDRQIMASRVDQVVGIKKFLVFYRGKPPHGSRTDWVMHEYYLACTTAGARGSNPPQTKNSTTYMGDWVLCHIFQKKRADRSEDSEMAVERSEDEVMTGRGQIRFIDFMGRRDTNSVPPPPASESSCVTELSSESNSEEEVICNSTTSPLFPCSNKEP